MNRLLPRAYWCLADTLGAPGAPTPGDLLATAPGQAVTWMRESVRGLTPGLDRDARHRARSWLDDRRTAEAAARPGVRVGAARPRGDLALDGVPGLPPSPVTEPPAAQEPPMNATHMPPAPPSPSAELRAALSEAGLRAAVADAGAGNDVRIAPLDPADARQLARLIRTGTKRALKTARALREICEGHRIGLPGLRVRQGRITLGPVRIEDAARLARLLGAVPPTAVRPGADIDAGTVRAMLDHAFPQATGGGALSVSVRENTPDLLDLGPIDARTARRLIRALQF